MPPRRNTRAKCGKCGRFLTKAGLCNACIARDLRNEIHKKEQEDTQPAVGHQQLQAPIPPVAPPPYPPPASQPTPPAPQPVTPLPSPPPQPPMSPPSPHTPIPSPGTGSRATPRHTTPNTNTAPSRRRNTRKCPVCGGFLTKAGNCNACIARNRAPSPPPPPPASPPPHNPRLSSKPSSAAPELNIPAPVMPPPLSPPLSPIPSPPPSPPSSSSSSSSSGSERNVPGERGQEMDVDSSDSSESDVELEPCCASCLCRIEVVRFSSLTLRDRKFSQAAIRRGVVAEIDLCRACSFYMCKGDGPVNNQGRNEEIPHHDVDDASSDDASSVADSEDSEDAAAQRRQSNKYLKWQFGWRAFLTDFILTSSNNSELERRLVYIPQAYSDLWGAQFLQKLVARNRVSARQFEHAMRTVSRKIVDITSDIQRINEDIGSGQLARLASALNTTAIATARCPFGCTEYIEKVGSVSYNHFLRWVFPDVNAFSANADLHLKGARADFTEPANEYGFSIMPSVRITVDMGLVLCTCANHDKGSPKLYVHPPKNPHGNLPSPYSDQLSPLIFAPKPFRGMKAKYASHTWQMRTVQGGFGGLSSFSVTTKPKWDIRSQHHGDLEALYREGRPDIDSFVMSNYSRNPLAQPGLDAVRNLPLPNLRQQQKALAGATFVSLDESINLLHSMKHKVSVVVDEQQQQQNVQQQHQQQPEPLPLDGEGPIDNGDENIGQDNDFQGGNNLQNLPAEEPENQNRRNVTWPLAYANAQICDSYGTIPKTINKFQSKFTPLLWTFIRLFTVYPALWHSFSLAEPIDANNEEEVLSLRIAKAYLSTFIPGCISSDRTLRGGAHRANPINVQNTLRSRSEFIHGLIANPQEDAACMDTSVILCRFLKTLPNTHAYHVRNRSVEIDENFIDARLQELPDQASQESCSVIAVCTTARATTNRRAARLLRYIHTDASLWDLVCIIDVDGNANSPWDRAGVRQENRDWDAKCILRNPGPFDSWFESCRKPCVERLQSPQAAIDNIRGSWKCLIYMRNTGGQLLKTKLDYLQYTGGQGTMVCDRHHIPLIVRPPASDEWPRLKCGYRDPTGNFCCDRVGKWSCPEFDCKTCLCRTHSKEAMTNVANDPQIVRVHPNPQQPLVGYRQQDVLQDILHAEQTDQAVDPLGHLIDQQHHEEGSSVSDGEQVDLPIDGAFDLDEPLGQGDLDENNRTDMPATNAGDIPVMTDNQTGLPGHILLNKHYGLLNRPGSVNYVSAKSGAFFQRLTARFAGASIPLLYPEGMLFPSIFWKSFKNGTVVGALPHCLWTSNDACKKAGFASLVDHIKTRLTDPTLLTSTDPRAIQFYFDALFNLQLSHSDSRIILSRGWEHLSSDPSTFQTLQVEGRLPFGEADSRKRVNELAAEISREQPTYFYTHSCNQSEHFGVSPIFQWLLNEYRNASDETRNSAIQAALVPILRAWQRAGTYLMKYIETSPEQPLGPVKKIWWRWEFQTTRGNLPHIHALVWTGEDPESDAVRHRVCAKRSHCFSDWQKFVDAGLAEDFEDACRLKELASVIHEHDCSKCGYRCHKKRDRDGKSICRFSKRPTSHEYSTQSIHVQHSDEALNILHQCGLAKPGITPCGTEELILTDELAAKKHMYPADPNTRFSPMNEWIFAAAKSSDNLQICSPAFTANYLAKYAAGEEERARVFLSAGKDENTIKIQQEGIRNVKITGAAIAAENDKARERPSTAVEGRTLSLTEAVWWLLNFPYVHLCSHYIHINTGFKQDRGGVIKHERQRVRPGGQGEEVWGVLARQALHFPPQRQFTDAQRLTVVDANSSNITVDSVSIYSSRPPELMFLNSLVDYFESVVRVPIPKPRQNDGDGNPINPQEGLLKVNIPDCPWIDGFDKQIKLLPAHLHRVKECAVAYRDDVARHSFAQRQVASQVIEHILDPLITQPTQDLLDRFVFQGSRKPHIAVLSNPLPRYADRFLIHLVLSLGRFGSEVELFSVNHLRQAFQSAGLIQNSANPTQQEVNSILRLYVLSQLLYLPGGTTAFDKHLIDANDALTSLLLRGNLEFYTTPLVLRHELTEAASEALVQRTTESKRAFAEALHCFSNPIHDLPPVDDLAGAIQANPLQWRPHIERGATQTLESFEEQQVALNIGLDTIDQFASGQSAFIPAPILLGPPGSGKSHVTAHWGAYALAKGLNTIVTSVASERAAALGGEHIHLVFSIPVTSTLSSRLIAERALTRLARDPVKMQWLKSVRVIIHEEIGTEGAELLDVQNKILQFLHNSALPFGGVLLMGSGDPNQLPPIKQTLLWTSPSIICTTRLIMLKHFVRSSTDANLQEVLTLFQKLQPTEADIHRIQELIFQHCHFSPDWDTVPSDALQVFGHRQAEQEAVLRQLERIQQDNTIPKVVVESQDQYTLDGGQVWLPVTQERIVNKMNRKLQAPQSITLHFGAIMRFTCNDTSARRAFHQSQLCVVRELPVNEGSFSVRVAPAGRRNVPQLEQDFIDQGWQELTISKMFSIPQRLEGTMKVRREQYPVRHYIASTIHKVMGDTLGMVATEISDKRSAYKLWLKSQLYVIISRVRAMNHIYFVGNIDDTMSAVRTLLGQSTQWDGYVRHIVGILTGAPAAPPVIQMNLRPFRPRDTPIPSDLRGYVYVIVASRHTTVSYIGQCRNLRQRINEHNSRSSGARFTALAQFQPWACLAYIVGFDQSVDERSNRSDREQVEHTWNATANNLYNGNPTPQNVLDAWQRAYDDTFHRRFPNLVMIQCGDI